MKRITLIIIFLLCLMVTELFGQTTAERENNLYLMVGVDANAFASFNIGFGYKFQESFRHRGLLLYTNLSIPVLLSTIDRDIDTWRVDTGVSAEIFRANRIGIRSRFNLFLIRHNQVLGTFYPAGFDLQMEPVYHLENGYIGIQLGWHQVIATHITHSEYSKSAFDNIYDKNGELIDLSPKDGWYGDTGSALKAGFEWSYPFADGFEMFLDSGLISFTSPYTGLLDSMMAGQVPFYFDIAISSRL